MNEAVAVTPKRCSACGVGYPAEALFCPADGTALTDASRAPSSPEGEHAPDAYLGQEIAGHIEIRKLVGVGAMGRVYRAFQRGIERDVAVKILHQDLGANAQLVSRFTREAKVASRLQHPNVVQVLLAGQLPDRALYMVMEYLDGLSLQSALAAAGGSFPVPRAMHIILQLCEAVGEAHAQGIVHRDLKPENVMLVRRGSDPDFAKVLDFGIARINWGEPSAATAAGLIFGTARYISPEGAQGTNVGPASDVYSIATLLYQMLSGRTPFEGDQALGLLVQQIHDAPPPLRSLPGAERVSPALADVIMTNLAKEPSKRAADGRVLGALLAAAAKSDPLAAKPTAAATVKWTPPVEGAARFAAGLPTPHATPVSVDVTTARDPAAVAVAKDAAFPTPHASPTAPRAAFDAPVEATVNDLSLDAEALRRTPEPSAVAAGSPTPRPTPVAFPAATERTSPSYPVAAVVTPPHAHVPTAYAPREASRPPSPSGRRSSSALIVALCFLLGAGLAGGFAWYTGRIGGPGGDPAQFADRATDAMYRNHFAEPAGDNVLDITNEGLRRWPGERRLLDIRARASNELVSQALAHRAAGNVGEALKLARTAAALDPKDTSARRLLEQYEAELVPLPQPNPEAAAASVSAPSFAPPLGSAPQRTKTARSAKADKVDKSEKDDKNDISERSVAPVDAGVPPPERPAPTHAPAATPAPAPSASGGVKWM